MDLDQQSAMQTMSALWSPVLAITTAAEDRVNGQIAIAGLWSSVLPEAPRVLIELWKSNYTHDLIRASGVFALHLLPDAPQPMSPALQLLQTLGLRSGRDADKMAGLAWHAGITGSPILEDALRYVEAQVVATLDAEEMTIFLGRVVAAGTCRDGEVLSWAAARKRMPDEWVKTYEANRKHQQAEARRRRQSADTEK